MTARIGKRTRDQAARICDMAASSSWCTYQGIADAIGAGNEAIDLASAACGVAVDALLWLGPQRGMDAHAAALLRDGWCPGDPVVRLRGGK